MPNHGTRVELIHTNDPHTKLKPGDQGIVCLTDHTGTIFVDWDNGSQLGLLPGIDRWKEIEGHDHQIQ